MPGPAPRDHLASFRTSGKGDDGWSVVCQATGRRISGGALTLTGFASDDEAVTMKLSLDQPLPGLPFGEPIVVVARWVSAAFRRLAIETETEQGVQVPETTTVNGVRASVADCQRRVLRLRPADSARGEAEQHRPPHAVGAGRVLDIKAGYLEILVEPTGAAGTARADETQAFTPTIQRCLDLTPGRGDRPLTRNVSLSFGSGGFTMAEPGGYRLTPVLTVPGRAGGPATVVLRGSTLAVWVAYPKTQLDEMHATRLLQQSVGAWTSLAGGSSFGDAATVVREIQEERMKVVENPLRDPLTVSLSRTLGIHFSRSYLVHEKQELSTVRKEPELAATMLRPLVDDAGALNCFDPTTARETEELAAEIERLLRPEQPPPEAL